MAGFGILLFGCLILSTSSQLLPPKWRPGDVMDSVDNTDINKALDDVLRAGDLLDSHIIAVGLANSGGVFTFSSPKWYIDDGHIDTLLAESFGPEHTSLSLFIRNLISLSGTAGVFTYDIDDTPLMVAVYYAVPLLGSNSFNVKIYPKGAANKNLFTQMRDFAGPWGTGGWETRSEFGISIRAAVTDGNKAKLTIFVDSSAYDYSAGPSYNAWCHESLFGDRCHRECVTLGYCETDHKCSGDGDCDGSRLQCNSACTTERA